KARVPGDDAVVLKGDEAKHWSDYRKLGAPGDLRKAIEEGATHQAEAGTLRKAEVTRSAAELHGFKPIVLGTLAKALEITIGDRLDKDGKPVLKDGKPVKAALVKGEGDKLTALDDYAGEHWKDFLPSLSVEPPQTTKPRGTPRPEQSRQAGNGNGNTNGNEQEPPKRHRSGF